jgi:hypothetical protein
MIPADGSLQVLDQGLLRVELFALALDLYAMRRDECRASRGFGHHLVQEAYIVFVDKHLFHVDSLDDVMRLLERLQVGSAF